MTNPPRILTSPGSQHCRRVSLLIHELSLNVELETVDVRPPGMGGQNSSEAFLALNANGKVPVLVHGDDVVLNESNAIMAYLCDLYGETPLWPKEPAARSQVLAWQFWQASHLSPTADGLMIENMVKPMFGTEPDAQRIQTLNQEFERWGRVLDGALVERAFLLGDELTCADLSVIAALMYAQAAQLDIGGHPHLSSWINRMHRRESWSATEPPPLDLSLLESADGH